MSATVPAAAVTSLLQAISDRLTIPPGKQAALGYRLAAHDAIARVQLAIAGTLGDGCDEESVARFTRLLAGDTSTLVYTEPPGVQCGPGRCTCGATVDHAGVVHPAVAS